MLATGLESNTPGRTGVKRAETCAVKTDLERRVGEEETELDGVGAGGYYVDNGNDLSVLKVTFHYWYGVRSVS